MTRVLMKTKKMVVMIKKGQNDYDDGDVDDELGDEEYGEDCESGDREFDDKGG